MIQTVEPDHTITISIKDGEVIGMHWGNLLVESSNDKKENYRIIKKHLKKAKKFVKKTFKEQEK